MHWRSQRRVPFKPFRCAAFGGGWLCPAFFKAACFPSLRVFFFSVQRESMAEVEEPNAHSLRLAILLKCEFHRCQA